MAPKSRSRRRPGPGQESPKAVHVAGVSVGPGCPLAVIAGPCVIESRKGALRLAEDLAAMSSSLDIPLIFKASYDKANRTSLRSFRGPGLKKGLDILGAIKERTGLPLLTDVHSPAEAEEAARVADILQIPAFLCRQTDLILAAAATGRAVNIKKGQFLAPEDVRYPVEKARSTGNSSVLVTERGTTFGYHRLVVDFASLPAIRNLGVPAVFDATHSVQMPGGEGGRTGGSRELVPCLARAAAAAGCDAFFFEVHHRPDRAKSDAANSITPTALEKLLPLLKEIDRLGRGAKP